MFSDSEGRIYTLRNYRRKIDTGEREYDIFNKDGYCLYKTYLNLSPLEIRNGRPGDRFCPLGLGGSKKLSRFLADQKVPLRQRSRVPILLFRDRIAWVAGFRLDERFKVDSRAFQVLRVWMA